MKITYASLFRGGAIIAILSLVALRVDADFMQRNVLTEEQIGDLQTEVAGRREGETVQFTASFGAVARLADRDRSRHVARGTIPFRITADYVQFRTVNNRQVRQRLPGRVHFYVMDEAGSVVVNQTMQVERMCPS